MKSCMFLCYNVFMTFEEKIKKTKEVIKEADRRWREKEIAIAWTGGKDSTVVLHLTREVFHGKVPFKVMFNDSTFEFSEVYEFIKKISKSWRLDLIWQKHLPEDLQVYQQAMEKGDREQAMEIMRIAKINAINYAIEKYKIKAFISGIRWDEHEARSKEKYFSPRSTHTRVHPILHFTLDDILEIYKNL